MFKEKLIAKIKQDGSISIEKMMGLGVAHYYNNKDPFGVCGDFITAPEVSQIFGELLGAWVADSWAKIGSPASWALVEIGPGRGTLMFDMLRVINKLPVECSIHLVEQSSLLKDKQKKILKKYNVAWHEGLETLPKNVPLIIVANEFLDALPIQQFECIEGHWFERSLDEKLKISLNVSSPHCADFELKGEGIFEKSPAREDYIKAVSERLKSQKGAALFIDYGHEKTSFGDTLQALKNHKYVPVFENIGEADLTSHVDFEALSKASSIFTYPLKTQREFLMHLGIEIRASMLNSPSADLDRLIGKDQMGDLFKVFCLSDKDYGLEGFCNGAL